MIAIIFLISALTFSSIGSADAIPSVQFDQFQPGHYWRWLYSEWNSQDQNFKPYYVERYTVTAVEGKMVTIEMRSAGVPNKQGPAHHKFILDFSKCERAARDPRFKNFSVHFYSKSFNQDWELVSNAHSHKVFTEKFNCASPFPGRRVEYQKFSYQGREVSTFQVPTQPPRKDSWYFLDEPELKGVAAYKSFAPNGAYKLEFIDQGG